jgi:ABC-type Fe3+-citrate transport system substrate-binding protein
VRGIISTITIWREFFMMNLIRPLTYLAVVILPVMIAGCDIANDNTVSSESGNSAVRSEPSNITIQTDPKRAGIVLK